jgi:hypothetical protein
MGEGDIFDWAVIDIMKPLQLPEDLVVPGSNFSQFRNRKIRTPPGDVPANSFFEVLDEMAINEFTYKKIIFCCRL